MRKFKIWTYSTGNDTVTKYTLSDLTSDEGTIESTTGRVIRPNIAEFPVTQLHAAPEQLHLAKILRDYLNKIEESKQQAVEQTALVDLLSAAAPTII